MKRAIGKLNIWKIKKKIYVIFVTLKLWWYNEVQSQELKALHKVISSSKASVMWTLYRVHTDYYVTARDGKASGTNFSESDLPKVIKWASSKIKKRTQKSWDEIFILCTRCSRQQRILDMKALLNGENYHRISKEGIYSIIAFPSELPPWASSG